MQDLGRTINYWSVGISHVHWTRQFKLSRTRQYIVEHRVDVKYMVHVAIHVLSRYWLLNWSEMCLRSTGDG